MRDSYRTRLPPSGPSGPLGWVVSALVQSRGPWGRGCFLWEGSATDCDAPSPSQRCLGHGYSLIHLWLMLGLLGNSPGQCLRSSSLGFWNGADRAMALVEGRVGCGMCISTCQIPQSLDPSVWGCGGKKCPFASCLLTLSPKRYEFTSRRKGTPA